MKKQSIIFMLICVMAMPLMAQNRNNEDEVVKLENHSYGYIPGQVLVKFTDNSSVSLRTTRGVCRSGVQAIDEVLQQYTVSQSSQLCAKNPTRSLRQTPSYAGGMVAEHDMTKLYKITLDSTQVRQTFDFIEALKALPDVEYAEPNYLVYALGNTDNTTFVETVCTPSLQHQGTRLTTPNDPLYSQQWGISVVGLDSLWTVDTAYAVDGSDRPIIAILDTGVDPDHPDLAANIWTNPNESGSNNGVDDDHNGFIDDLHGWDFINQTSNMHDFNSHGTHCAGIAAAAGNNGVGIIGANPHALIMPVSVLQSNGNGDIATIIQGINYAANNGADVISMSFGTYTYSIALEQALGQAYQSAVLVAAAGNDGFCMTKPGNCRAFRGDVFPAALTFVLGVQASDQIYSPATWSNIDCDGPIFSEFPEEQLYNYELTAPGASIISTIPGGQYRSYNGTSMACPLVAGGISALMHAKNYASKEQLFGDLINYSDSLSGNVDFYACYQGGVAPAQLQLITYVINDPSGNSNHKIDAGETLVFYPTLRTTWGAANNIYYWIEFAEFEDNTLIDFPTSPTPFGHNLSAYAKNIAANSLSFHVNNNIADGRNINLVFKAICANSQDTLTYNFSIEVENGVYLPPNITSNMVLTPNVHYIADGTIIVKENKVLTIKPGVTIKVKGSSQFKILGRLYAVGTPDSIINIIGVNQPAYGQTGVDLFKLSNNDTVAYVNFNGIACSNGILASENVNAYARKYFGIDSYSHAAAHNIWVENCEFQSCVVGQIVRNINLYNCHIHSNSGVGNTFQGRMDQTNYINNHFTATIVPPSMLSREYLSLNVPLIVEISDVIDTAGQYPTIHKFFNSNIASNYCAEVEEFYPEGKGICNIEGYEPNNSGVLTVTNPSYYGSSVESVVKKSVIDCSNPINDWLLSTNRICLDIPNMLTAPNPNTHGFVWKILVNGYDAQDQSDSVIPLGIGQHQIQVYYNRAMDVSYAPTITMGVRSPWTQIPIAENGSWSADSTVYTAYVTLTGNSNTEGKNRISVSGGYDSEHFTCPTENRRFDVQVATTGTLSAGFEATAGLRKIDLSWNNEAAQNENFMGYNLYRTHWDTVYVTHTSEYWWVPPTIDTLIGFVDTVCVNSSLLTDSVYTDYNVQAGTRYYYFYRVLHTDLSEGTPSKTVSAVPLSSTPGDANGSFNVDVLDIVTVVRYMTGENPDPFIFELADVNGDQVINVMDIVRIVNLILQPNNQPSRNHYTATYTIEDGILHVDCPVAIAGVQFSLSGINANDISILEALNGFEHVSSTLPNGDLLFIAYSCIGNCIPAGRHALLRIGSAGIDDILLSDDTGTQIDATPRNATAVISSTISQLSLGKPYPNPFSNSITIPYSVNSDNVGKVDFVVSDLLGRIIDHIEIGAQTNGEHQLIWSPKQALTNGIYFIQMRANGLAIQSAKIIYSK